MTNYSALERYRPLVDDWEAFILTLQRPLPLCLWTNTLRATPEEVAEELDREGLTVTPVGWYPGAFRLAADVKPGNRLPYLSGLYHVQEEVSMLPPFLLKLAHGQRVIDLCSAPGNKTAQAALMLGGKGTVVANDLNEGRLHVLRTTLSRLGLPNVSTTVFDAAEYPLRSRFDGVMLDGPCSCEGTSRKHLRVLDAASVSQSCSMGGRLGRMLLRAVRLCKPGGRIAYSTCTYAPEENEAVVDLALRHYGPNVLHIVPAAVPGLVTTPGLTEWEGAAFHSSMSGALRVWPHHNDTGGFFVAVLEKSGDEVAA